MINLGHFVIRERIVAIVITVYLHASSTVRLRLSILVV